MESSRDNLKNHIKIRLRGIHSFEFPFFVLEHWKVGRSGTQPDLKSGPLETVMVRLHFLPPYYAVVGELVHQEIVNLPPSGIVGSSPTGCTIHRGIPSVSNFSSVAQR